MIALFTEAFTIQFGHIDVCDDYIRLLSLNKIEPLFSIPGHNHLVAYLFEFDFDHAPYVDIVIDDQNLLIVSQCNIAPLVS